MIHFVEWTTSCLRKGGNLAKSWEKVRASGPLFGVDHWLLEKVRKLGQKLGKGVSQWSTLESGPLAPRKRSEIRSKAGKRRGPVVHF